MNLTKLFKKKSCKKLELINFKKKYIYIDTQNFNLEPKSKSIWPKFVIADG